MGNTNAKDKGKEQIANAPDMGPLGFGLLPRLKGAIGRVYMKKFISDLYTQELKLVSGYGNSHVAHASTDPDMNTMNIAMPDTSAEYWVTFIPEGKAPIVNLAFPSWAGYSAITAYDCAGLPITSVNKLEAAGGQDARVTSNEDGTYSVNLMLNSQWSGIIVLIHRIYRPSNIAITPEEELSKVRLIPRSSLMSPPEATASDWLRNATQTQAITNGRRFGEAFIKLVSSALKPLTAKQKGSQWFSPRNVGGLYPNANANYVVCFLPDDKEGIIIRGTTPRQVPWRCFYGFMAVDKNTTATIDSRTVEQLGGWDSKFQLFLFRTQSGAEAAGYDVRNSEHSLMIFGDSKVCKAPGAVLRYLHYFKASSGLNASQVASAQQERRKLKLLDGTKAKIHNLAIPGADMIIEYI